MRNGPSSAAVNTVAVVGRVESRLLNSEGEECTAGHCWYERP